MYSLLTNSRTANTRLGTSAMAGGGEFPKKVFTPGTQRIVIIIPNCQTYVQTKPFNSVSDPGIMAHVHIDSEITGKMKVIRIVGIGSPAVTVQQSPIYY